MSKNEGTTQTAAECRWCGKASCRCLPPHWRSMSDVPHNGCFGVVRWNDGTDGYAEFEPVRSVEWWTENGATHWRGLTEGELEDFTDD